MKQLLIVFLVLFTQFSHALDLEKIRGNCDPQTAEVMDKAGEKKCTPVNCIVNVRGYILGYIKANIFLQFNNEKYFLQKSNGFIGKVENIARNLRDEQQLCSMAFIENETLDGHSYFIE